MHFRSFVGPALSLGMAVAILFATGCSGSSVKTLKVSGSVSHKGQPVPNVNVVFNPATEGAKPGTAVTDANGKFDSVTTFEPGDGVVPGKHKITLATITKGDQEITSAEAYSDPAGSKLPFPSKYLNSVETDATVEVNQAGQTVQIELKD